MRYFSYFFATSVLITLASCAERYEVDGQIVDQTYVHRYGVEVPADHWEESGQHGQVVSRLKDGVTVTTTYNAGIVDGETSYTYPHSSVVQKVETYAQGRLNKVVSYYTSRAPEQEIAYSSPGDWTLTTWYEEGSPQSKEVYQNQKLVSGEYFNPAHQLESNVNAGQGTRSRRDGYGLLVSTETIVNGQLATRTTYYPNGAPKETTPYQNNVIAGSRRTFLPGGEPSTIEQWQEGQQQGTTIVFQNGEKFAEVPYVNGIKQGVEKRYHDGEHVAEEITWVNGQKHGAANTFVGDNVRTDWYFQDKQVTKTNFDLMGRTASL